MWENTRFKSKTDLHDEGQSNLGTSTSSTNRTTISNIEYRYIGQYFRVSHDALELYKANTSTFDPCVLKGVPDRTSNPDYSFCICTSSPYQTLGFYEKRTIVCCSSLRYSILEKWILNVFLWYLLSAQSPRLEIKEYIPEVEYWISYNIYISKAVRNAE